jgi:hypothetical protein
MVQTKVGYVALCWVNPGPLPLWLETHIEGLGNDKGMTGRIKV